MDITPKRLPERVAQNANSTEHTLRIERNLRALAPKRLKCDRQAFQRPGIPKTCAVCGSDACRLRSHKDFIRHKLLPLSGPRSGKCHEQIAKSLYTKSYAYFWAQQYVDADPAASQIDPFYNLPIPEGRQPGLNRLFRDCESLPLCLDLPFCQLRIS
jgi:hypothetical protein